MFLLIVDYMMSLGGCVSVVELRFLTMLMLCCGVAVTNHELSKKFVSCILMYWIVIVDPWAPVHGM